MSADATRWVTLGRVSGLFGVKGWLKVQSYTEPRGNVANFDVWTLRMNGADRAFAVEEGRKHGNSVVAKLRGIDDREGAREWIGAEIVVERAQLPATRADEFYWADLVGLEVRTTADVVLGRVDHLLATGGNDVLVVRGPEECLIPFILGSVVKHVDLEGGRIVVDWSPDY